MGYLSLMFQIRARKTASEDRASRSPEARCCQRKFPRNSNLRFLDLDSKKQGKHGFPSCTVDATCLSCLLARISTAQCFVLYNRIAQDSDETDISAIPSDS